MLPQDHPASKLAKEGLEPNVGSSEAPRCTTLFSFHSASDLNGLIDRVGADRSRATAPQ